MMGNNHSAMLWPAGLAAIALSRNSFSAIGKDATIAAAAGEGRPLK